MPEKSPVSRIIVLSCALLFLLLSPAYSAVNDGFGEGRKISGKYFTVMYKPGVEVGTLTQQLNIGLTDKILSGNISSQGNSSAEAELAEMLDILFLTVSDILDVHLYSFQGTIKVCPDEDALASVYKNLFEGEPGSRLSFYVNELNAIYITAGHFKREILGHEIAHAILSHYFVVQPPVKVAEVLAGYVEYQLRKPDK